MGHCLSGVLVHSNYDDGAIKKFDLRPVKLLANIVLLPTTNCYLDHWEKVLDVTGSVSDRPFSNVCVLHHMVRQAVGAGRYAVFDTDYFGGQGDQSAAVYEKENVIMPPTVAAKGPINAALRLLGVHRGLFTDAFARVGLDRYRQSDDFYSDYETQT
jgi:hypothetical protein